jgi:hypothetical protein
MPNKLLNKFVELVREIKKELVWLLGQKNEKIIIFDHLPKCGGTSLSHYLEDNYPYHKTFSINGHSPKLQLGSIAKFKSYSEPKRLSFSLVKGHGADQLFDYCSPDSFKVTVLREPIDRIISHYYYVKRQPSHYLYHDVMSKNMSLFDYVDSGLSIELRNYYTTHFCKLPANEVTLLGEEAVEIALRNISLNYNLVGFVDNLDNFMNKLSELCDLKPSLKLNKANVTSNRKKVEEIDQATLSKIAEVNNLDILLYQKLKLKFL